MNVFLGYMISVMAGCILGVIVGRIDGKERFADLMQKYYPDTFDYILKESRGAYDDEELEIRGELLRAKDRA